MNSAIPILFFLLAQTVNSSQGLFFGIINFDRTSELAAETFTLYNRNHEIIYKKIAPQANTFFITDFGTVFALNEKNLFFYKQNGDEIFLKELNCPNGFCFSSDQALFFASDRDGIFAYANDGKLMYQLRGGRLFASNENGRQIATISNDTLFFHEDGVIKFSRILATPYARNLEFSGDKKSLIIKEPNGTETLDLVNGRITAE